MDDGLPPMEQNLGTHSKVLKADSFEALSRARMEIDQAHNQAQAIVAEAYNQAEAIRAEAQAQGQQQAAALVAEYAARMHTELSEAQLRMTDVVSVALKRILQPIPSAAVVASAVQRAMTDADIGQGAVLVVAPSLAAPLREQFAQRKLDPKLLEVQGDPECPLESTILRSQFGDIELSIDVQLRAIEQGLQAARAEVTG